MSVLHLFSKIRTTFILKSDSYAAKCASKIGARKKRKKKNATACGLLVVIALNLYQKIFVLRCFSYNDVFVFKRLALWRARN